MSALVFQTANGRKVPAVNREQMVNIDRLAMDVFGPNLFQMMENAGRNLAELALERLGAGWNEARVTVLAGRGGNGGGGICAGRHLANRGLAVRLALTGEPQGVPAQQLALYKAAGGEVGEPMEADLVLDAIIGYSLKGEPRGKALELINWCNRQTGPVLSLDLPSGIEAGSGEAPGSVVQAETTMTLALPKIGSVAPEGGRLILADIGIPAAVYAQAKIDYTCPFENRFRVELFLPS